MSRYRQHYKTLSRQKERLKEDSSWFLVPSLFTFILVLILLGRILPGVNPRVGHHARVIDFKTAQQQEGSIWMAVTPVEGRLAITTADRKIFFTSLRNPSDQEFSGLVEYLRELANSKIKDAALAGRAALHEFTVVLAVDERLRYAHVRNIIAALGQAGFSQYGFETLIMKSSATYASSDKP